MAYEVVRTFVIPLLLLALEINPVSRGYEHFPMAMLASGRADRQDLVRRAFTVTGLFGANIDYHVEHQVYPEGCNLPKLHHVLENKVLPRDRWWLARLFMRTHPAPAVAEPQCAT